jgi:hypothetical protein
LARRLRRLRQTAAGDETSRIECSVVKRSRIWLVTAWALSFAGELSAQQSTQSPAATRFDLVISLLAVTSPLLLALLAGVGWLYRHERERRAAAEQQISERKRAAYLQLLEIFFGSMKAISLGKAVKGNEKNLIEKMWDANQELILYGSDEVIRIYQAWLGEAREGFLDLEKFGQLIVAVRRDMGHMKTDISHDEVLRPFIRDYDEMKKGGRLRVPTGQ